MKLWNRELKQDVENGWIALAGLLLAGIGLGGLYVQSELAAALGLIAVFGHEITRIGLRRLRGGRDTAA